MRPGAGVRRVGVVLLAVGLTASNPVASTAGNPVASTAGNPVASTASNPVEGNPVEASRSEPATASAAPFRSVRTYRPVAVPVRLRIPSRKIDTPLRQLGLAADGTIAAPREWQVAGWYDGGPRPGQNGPAVIVGHIDSRAGPAVFFRLPDLERGAAVYVDRKDGSTARFRVTGRRQVAKDRFPAAAVYSPSLQPSLVLITCGGTFDRSVGHYRDNIIVTAIPG